MGRLEDLLQEYCPNGVKYKKLIDVADILYGFPCKSSNFNDNGNGMPIVRIRDICKGYSEIFTTEKIDTNYYIKNGDFLVGMDGNFNSGVWNGGTAILCQRTCKISPKINKNLVINGFLIHLLGPIFKKIEMNKQSGTVKHLLAKDINSIKIPVPPLPVQEEIVRILDDFTKLNEKLNEELIKRKKQYEYYRDKLLNFDNKIKYMSLGELFEIKNGLNKEKEAFGKGIPIINFKDVYNNRWLDKNSFSGLVNVSEDEIERYSARKGDIFFTRTSETREDIGMASALIEDVPNCVFSGFILRARPTTKLLIPKFCAYYFSTTKVRNDIIRYASFTTRATTTGPKLSKLLMPIIPIVEQEYIVSILDKFNILCNDLLPAEIETRKKQYEYYRNKLLTFKELK